VNLNKVLVILCICAAVAGVWVFSPTARQEVKGWFRAAREDIAPSGGSATFGGQVKVYVPRGDVYYHVKDCPRMEGKIGVIMPLNKARELYMPCPECNPPR
jgi:hypothetical protein